MKKSKILFLLTFLFIPLIYCSLNIQNKFNDDYFLSKKLSNSEEYGEGYLKEEVEGEKTFFVPYTSTENLINDDTKLNKSYYFIGDKTKENIKLYDSKNTSEGLSNYKRIKSLNYKLDLFYLYYDKLIVYSKVSSNLINIYSLDVKKFINSDIKELNLDDDSIDFIKNTQFKHNAITNIRQFYFNSILKKFFCITNRSVSIFNINDEGIADKQKDVETITIANSSLSDLGAVNVFNNIIKDGSNSSTSLFVFKRNTENAVHVLNGSRTIAIKPSEKDANINLISYDKNIIVVYKDKFYKLDYENLKSLVENEVEFNSLKSEEITSLNNSFKYGTIRSFGEVFSNQKYKQYYSTDSGLIKIEATKENELINLNDSSSYQITKLSNSTFLSQAGNTGIDENDSNIYSFDYNKGSIKVLRKVIDISWMQDFKFDLHDLDFNNPKIDEFFKSAYEIIFKQLIYQVKEKNQVENFSKLYFEDIYKLFSIKNWLVNDELKTTSEKNNWFKQKFFDLKIEGTTFILGTPKIKVYNYKDLEWIKNETIDYTKEVFAIDYKNNTKEYKELIDNISELIKQIDKNIILDEENITSFDLSKLNDNSMQLPVKSSNNVNSSLLNPLNANVNIKFTNIIKKQDLASITNEIKSKTNVNKEVSYNDSKENLLKWIIKNTSSSLDNINIEISNDLVWNELNNSAKATIKISQKNMLLNSETFDLTYTNFSKEKITIQGSWLNNFDPLKMIENNFEGEFKITNFKELDNLKIETISNDSIIKANLNNDIVKVSSKNSGKASISLSADNSKDSLTLNFNVYKEDLDFGNFDFSNINMKKNELVKIDVENYDVFKDLKIISNDYNNKINTSIENKQVVIKANEYEKNNSKFTVTVEGKNLKNEIKTKSFVVEIKPPFVFPLWLIILLSTLLILLILVLIIIVFWIIWVKKRSFNKRKRINASSNYVAHVILPKKRKLKNENGFLRSGVFEKELEQNLKKINSPVYQKKYFGNSYSGLEDNSPSTNWWRTHKEQGLNSKSKKTIAKTNNQKNHIERIKELKKKINKK
ncbi:hypothetical protein SGLAD_v1c05370 [Spiroplasma gladiatoris]|uniref:Uncharacterized protein n=1 Tax=Spiroplasma gladiatoris TaxID=2143 RepID=A0A4P7AJA0_9MOLU|nr:hypothetical protein [Spiroplasma gladiatoris]QBQ07736.1 hypothetical protein SGLAD_v1c05370 [Spiroplasma gladiatoris]